MRGANPIIEFTVEPDGTIRQVIEGIKGPACKALADRYSGLGRVTRDENTEEFYERETLSTSTPTKTSGRG